MIKYTAIDIMKLKPCYGIQQIEQLGGGREELSLTEICRLNIGLTDIIWVVSRILPERAIRLFTADCAEHVLHLYEREYPDDERPRECIDVARKYANGNASRGELDAARSAGWAAVSTAARDAAWSASNDAVKDAVRDAARAASWSAAYHAAARDAARVEACRAACDAAKVASWITSWDAEQKWQLCRLIEYVTEAEGNPSKGKKHA